MFSEEKVLKVKKVGKKLCQYHGTYGHSANECITIKTLVKQAKLKKAKHSKERKYTKHEVDILVETK